MLTEMITLQGVSTFVSTLKNLIGIKPSIRSKKERVFEDVIDPIYKELEPAVADFLRLLSTLRSDLADIEPRKIRSEYEKNRNAMFTARVAIRENCDALRAISHNATLNRFLDNVQKIFQSIDVPAGGYKISRSYQMASLLKLLEQGETDQGEMQRAIDTAMKEVEYGFVAASQVHAVQKVRHMKRLLTK